MNDTNSVISTKKSKYIRNESGHFTCPHCDKVTERQNTMFYHLKKHAGDLSYRCTETGCDRAFIQKSGLQQHVAQAHPDVTDKSNPYANHMYTCPEENCDHACRMKANLMIHIARKHSPWIPAYTGSCLCLKSFASATAYYYHATSCASLQG
jgi:uncharacterized C2H2 Zn-finger protein